MNQTASVQGFGTKKEAREQLKQQLAQYVGQQPESTQVFHRWMTRLEMASLAVVAAVFVLAMYLSINWATVPTKTIPTAWFAFPVSFALTMVLVGLHAAILRAFPPVVLPGKVQKFVTGSGAMWAGLGSILTGLAVASFWGLFAYSVWTLNLAMLEPLIGILGVVMGVGIVISMLVTTFQKIFKSR